MVSPFCSESLGFAHYCEKTRVFRLICRVEHFTLIYYTIGPQLLDIDATDEDLGEENHGEDQEPESDHN